jgi:hypothetical protein
MDFLRTLKKRRPKKRTRAAGYRAKPRGIRIRRRDTTLNVASCFALFFLGMPRAVTQATPRTIANVAMRVSHLKIKETYELS